MLLAIFEEVAGKPAEVVAVIESADDSVDELRTRSCMTTTGSCEETEEAAVSRFTVREGREADVPAEIDTTLGEIERAISDLLATLRRLIGRGC